MEGLSSNMAFFRQLRLLMWKNFLLQRKKICVTVFEIVLPLLFGVIFFSMRFLVDIRHEPAQSYATRNVARRVTNYWYGDVTVLFTPNNTLINGLITGINGTLHNQSSTPYYSGLPTFRGFSSRKDMLDYYSYNSKQVAFAVEFENVAMTDTVLPKTLRCAIRPKGVEYGDGWHTTESTPFVATAGPRPLYGQDYQDFLGVQRLLHEAIIKHFNPKSTDMLDQLQVQMLRMPYPPFITDTMNVLLQYMFPVLLMLSFILMAIQTTKGVVYEKERKLKESIKLMGLSASAHWTSLFLTSFIYVLVIMALYTLLCGVDASGKGAALAKSDPSLFFVFLLCYGVSTISYCFMISVFTQRANIGAAISGIVFFISYCPYFYLQIIYQNMSRSAKLASCLLFNVGMAFGANVISLYEGAGSGVQWSNFHEPATVDDNFSLLDAILMLLGDTAIHLLITWYMDNVWPGEFGVPKPFHFPFTASYWCGTKRRDADYSSYQHLDEKHFEKEPSGMKTGISILNLKKVFSSGSKKKVAVDGMSLNMYEGQISVLLGHNGAGKTTTMSVLTGFIPSSGGTAIVNGYDINNDIQSVRQSLGLCPQHNILFDSLTVQEHLEFFACLKGCPSYAVQSEVNTMMDEVGLSQKRFTQSQHLSGGQKRKLSVGIALIGGSKIVILDEPTSGMDPAARRQTWDILQRNRQGRTMLLTTHFMDEADLLGDRIAIMTEGVVKCCGTSYFLKKLYGAGYHLVMVKGPTCQVASVTAVVQRHVPTAVMESEINAELSYLLPDDQSANFAALFTEIEFHRGKLGISSFGASATTMEEVFLKAGEEEQQEDGDVNEDYPTGSRNNLISIGTNGWSNSNYEMREAGTADILAFNRGFTKTRGIMLELSRFTGMFVKKALHTWRNRTITVVELLLPVLFAIAALAISKVDPGEVIEVPLTLDLAPFKGTYVPYKGGSGPLPQTLAQAYHDQFAGSENKPEMIDLSTYNVTSYFLSRAKELGIGGYNKKVIIGAQFKSSKEVIGFFNGQPYHSQPIALSFMMNAILKHFTSQDHSITTINNPLPRDDKETSETTLSSVAALGFSVAFCLIFGMAFLTSSFVYFLIKERQVGAKHLQTVSGVGPFVFWLSNLAWDYINYLIPSLLLLVVFAGFQSPAFTEDGRLGIVFLVLLVYGLAVLPFMYALQNMFKSPPTGMVVIIILNIITGLATLLSVFMMTTLNKKPEANIADWVFLVIFPHYNFGKSYMDMYSNYLYLDGCTKQNYTSLCATQRRNSCCKDSCGDFCFQFTENFLDWDSPGVGRYVVFMLIQGIMYMSVTLFIEYQIPQRIWYAFRPQETEIPQPGAPSFGPMQHIPEDEDVLRERQRILQLPIGIGNLDALVLKHVYKRYGNFIAVDHLSVGIPEKECFGLLGQNGAGKTTTFKMITGDVMLTHGNVFLRSFNIKNHTQKVQENMGYCPQFDALIDQMTGRETLTMYARLKGVPESCIKGVCDNLLDIMMLRQYSDKATSEYSGGNKRKLSTAIALVGDPAFIMLDEPSTGMDPKARRQLWNVLSKVRECGRTLVLTSHSMEECDALCTRIAIMVNGRFVCLGTPQHLKTKFGQGYTLIARMKTVETQPGISEERAPAPTEPLVNFITSSYPNTHVFDDHQGYVHFQVPYSAVSLAQVFTVMEQSKVQFSVEDYSVHQTTLEQVFLSFTRWQIPPKEDKTGLCKRICCCC